MLPPVTTESGQALAAPPRADLSARIGVVVNGNAKSVNQEVISTLDQILLGGDLFVSRSLAEAEEIARVLVARRYGTVLTGGGDGTFSVMVTEVYREAERQNANLPRFGYLKLGTGNALAHVVGASGAGSGGLAADIRRLREDAGSREIGLIEVEGRLAPFCGFGADAVVLRDYERVRSLLGRTPLRSIARGASGYTLSSLALTLPGYLRRGPLHCRVLNRGAHWQRVGSSGSEPQRNLEPPQASDGQPLFEGPAHLIAAGTIPYYGYGFRAFPFAGEQEDRMQLRISSLSWLPFLANFRSIWRGEYRGGPELHDLLVQSVEIQVEPAAPFQVGGDYLGPRSSVVLSMAPRRIRLVDFYAPPSAS